MHHVHEAVHQRQMPVQLVDHGHVAAQQDRAAVQFGQIVDPENHIVVQDHAVGRPDHAAALYNRKKVHRDGHEVVPENHAVNPEDRIVVPKDLEVAHGIVDRFDRTVVVHVSLVHKHVPEVVLCRTAPRAVKRDAEILSAIRAVKLKRHQ